VRASTGKSTLSNARAVLTMALLDEDVGAILGKKGQTLTQIQQVCTRAKCAAQRRRRRGTLGGGPGAGRWSVRAARRREMAG
jgi:predicted RNA-binding protein YlqC (UPF0109 family)